MKYKSINLAIYVAILQMMQKFYICPCLKLQADNSISVLVITYICYLSINLREGKSVLKERESKLYIILIIECNNSRLYLYSLASVEHCPNTYNTTD